MRSLLSPRLTFAPYEYPEAHTYWERQQQSHWLPSEVSLASDLQDWKLSLTAGERTVIGHILKGFVQSELHIRDYWSLRVSRWFPKPEISNMAKCFASMETVHAVSYALLNTTLGLEDFDAFLQDPSAKAKIDRLIAAGRGNDPREIALSLAVFSAFNEGVSLFSSFAVLLNFSRFNKLKGMGQIIAFSIKDESLHAEAGCWLFRQLVQEKPELLTPALREEILEAARLTVALEEAFIRQAFTVGTVEGLTEDDLCAFIRHRTNTKLGDLGLPPLWTVIDARVLGRMAWFDVLSAGVSHTDFFASRVTDYARGVLDFTNVWDDPPAAPTASTAQAAE